MRIITMLVPVMHDLLQHLQSLTQKLIEHLASVGEFKHHDDLHVSLSRTFVIRHHWINPLLAVLKDATSKLPG